MKNQRTWKRRFGQLAIAFFVFAWLGYWGLYRFDHQNANIALTLCLIFAALFGLLGFLAYNAILLKLRLLSLSIPIIGTTIFLLNYEFRGFSGELVPQFRHRSSNPRKSQQNENIAAVDRQYEPTTRENFPSFRQFLGNDRTGIVTNIQLAEAWNAESPRILWKTPIGPGWSGFAIQNGLSVTLEEFEGRDCIVALDWNDGSVRWRTPLERRHYHAMDGGGPSATPTIDGERFFAQSSTGIVCCGELATGKLLWKVDLLEKAGINQSEAEKAVTWGRSGSPLLEGNLIIVPFGGAPGKSPGGLIALDHLTGEERWRGGDAQISYASPSIMTILGQKQIVMVNESTVTGHDPQTGNVLWSHDWPGQSNGGATVSQAVAIDSTRVLISKAYGGGAEMLDFSGSSPSNFVIKSLWKDKSLLKTKFTSAIYREGFLYALSDGILECVEADSGKRKWKDSRNGRLGHGQLLVVGIHLVVSCEDGRIVVGRASPDALHKVGEFSVLSGITWNTIAIAGNRILMRNGEQAACIEIPIEQDLNHRTTANQ